jgi:hypothetical protein
MFRNLALIFDYITDVLVLIFIICIDISIIKSLLVFRIKKVTVLYRIRAKNYFHIFILFSLIFILYYYEDKYFKIIAESNLDNTINFQLNKILIYISISIILFIWRLLQNFSFCNSNLLKKHVS